MAVTANGAVTNPEIREASLRIFDVCQIAVKRGARKALNLGQVKIPEGSLEELAQAAFQAEVGRNRNLVTAMAGRTRGTREPFVPLRPPATSAVLSFESNKSIIAQAVDAGQFRSLKLDRTLASLRRDIERRRARDMVALQSAVKSALNAGYLQSFFGLTNLFNLGSQPAQTPRPANQVRLRFASVKAVKRFGLEITDWGPDTMLCGGSAQDSVVPEPRLIKVAPIGIGTYENDGQVRNLSPDLVFAQFPLIGDQWPRSWLATIFLAESDASGAFLEFLRNVWDAIGEDVVKLATELTLSALGIAGGATAGLAAGTAAGTAIAPIIGSIVGAIIGGVIGLMAAWIFDSLEDDIFAMPGLITATLEGPTDRFDGALRSPTYTQQFTKGSAMYTVNYYWEIVE